MKITQNVKNLNAVSSTEHKHTSCLKRASKPFRGPACVCGSGLGGDEVVKCVHFYSPSCLPFCRTHHTWQSHSHTPLFHTVVPVVGHRGAADWFSRIWPSFYSNVSLFVPSMGEEAIAACGTKSTSSARSFQTIWPCLHVAHPAQKWLTQAKLLELPPLILFLFIYFDLPLLQMRKNGAQVNQWLSLRLMGHISCASGRRALFVNVWIGAAGYKKMNHKGVWNTEPGMDPRVTPPSFLEHSNLNLYGTFPHSHLCSPPPL